LVDALVARLHASGGTLWHDTPVARVVVRDGRARGVVLADGRTIRARRAVIAAVSAPALDRIVDDWQRPDDARRYQPGLGTVKVDWALRSPVPWSDPAARGAGTVHVAPTLDELSIQAHQLARSVLPARPFVVLGQMSTADPTRSPPGTESAWGYMHVPVPLRQDECGVVSGRYDRDDLERLRDRMEARVEELAPGFRDRIVAVHVAGPHELAAADASLLGGDISAGTVQLHQQGPFRPPGSLGGTATRVAGLRLGSASVHPGGGVHGGPGARAARAALRAAALHRPPARRATSRHAGTAEGPE
jgi:phytoene dehydrogenase-like protein